MIYLLTVNYYSTNFVTKLISSIQASKNIPHQTVIINNSPEDDSIHLLKSESVVILDAGANLGFGRSCNLGLNWIYAQNPKAIVWIINPDAYLLENSLEKVSLFIENHPELSIIGTIVYEPNGKIWFSGGSFIRKTGSILSPNLFLNNPSVDYIPSEWLTGASIIINFNKFTTCPHFDPNYFLYYEDFDFCMRYANQGHLIGITARIGIVHQPSSIANRNMYQKIKHSTFGYLLTLEKYTSKPVFLLRLIRLILYSLILLIVKPSVAFGKIVGVFMYFKHLNLSK